MAVSPLQGVQADVAAMRVMVAADQLGAALKVAESGVHDALGPLERRMSGLDKTLLVPVDFSDSSLTACRIAFQLAERLSLKVVLLHAGAAPYFVQTPLADDMGMGDGIGVDIEEAEADHKIDVINARQMHQLRQQLEAEIAAGSLPGVSFTTSLEEGVPEDVILNYTRTTPPELVVMASRGRDRSHTDALGSITAEVIDRCRVPLFTVPDNVGFKSIRDITRLVFLCTVTKTDILSMETLMRMFDYPDVEVWLVAVPTDTRDSNVEAKMTAFCDYLSETYPGAVFHTAKYEGGDPRDVTASLVSGEKAQLVIVPNRKTNLFQRLFRPGIAHKMFFEGDVPLLVLPV